MGPELKAGTTSLDMTILALTTSANACHTSGRQLPLAAPDVEGRIQIRVSAIRSVCSP